MSLLFDVLNVDCVSHEEVVPPFFLPTAKANRKLHTGLAKRSCRIESIHLFPSLALVFLIEIEIDRKQPNHWLCPRFHFQLFFFRRKFLSGCLWAVKCLLNETFNGNRTSCKKTLHFTNVSTTTRTSFNMVRFIGKETCNRDEWWRGRYGALNLFVCFLVDKEKQSKSSISNELYNAGPVRFPRSFHHSAFQRLHIHSSPL